MGDVIWVMKPKEIQKYIDMVEKSDISELEVSRWGKKVIIRKNSTTQSLNTPKNENIPQPQPQIESAPQQPSPLAAPLVEINAEEKTNSQMI